MAQVKIYGHASIFDGRQALISGAVQQASQDVLGLPPEKRFHRFFPLTPENFIHPADRSDQYLILEIHLFAGRTPETLREYILSLQKNLQQQLNMQANDIEITLIETPASHWGIRGQLGDQLHLTYEVNR